MNLVSGKTQSRKTCIKCRYYIKRKIGSYNLGFAFSNWGICQGHEHDNLIGHANKIGMVHKNMLCQLPNLGLPNDWKPIVRATPGMRQQSFYEAHPAAYSKHYDGSTEWLRQRKYALERQTELTEG